jgi:dephospho-CoA kinase
VVFVLGLTGSIGMGKSTTAAMFADEGLPVWDADAAVHRLYSEGGAAVQRVAAAFPAAVKDGAVSRDALAAIIATDPAALPRIEAIVHPLVAMDRQAFLDRVTADIAILDIPLLFETGADRWLDATLCVTAPPEVQAARVLERPGMSRQKLDMILSHQMPDADKRARADHVIETTDMDATRAAVRQVVRQIRQQIGKGKSNA